MPFVKVGTENSAEMETHDNDPRIRPADAGRCRLDVMLPFEHLWFDRSLELRLVQRLAFRLIERLCP
jgi:hypothetical protein